MRLVGIRIVGFPRIEVDHQVTNVGLAGKSLLHKTQFSAVSPADTRVSSMPESHKRSQKLLAFTPILVSSLMTKIVRRVAGVDIAIVPDFNNKDRNMLLEFRKIEKLQRAGSTVVIEIAGIAEMKM